MRTRRRVTYTTEVERQALDAFLAAGAEYNAALNRLQQYLTTTAPDAVRPGELGHIQRFQALLHEELARLEAGLGE